ncbi:MAG: putative surface protein with fasciclin (FAS1) repeats [Saprospiraceae bacterium]|jgi:uncharacterized surface protein with fasciclin (FAS1) repeats
MNIKLFLSLIVFTVLSTSIFAQCNSHHKDIKSVYHERNDIIDIASSDDQFSTLTTSIKIAGLVSTLQSEVKDHLLYLHLLMLPSQN